MLPPKYEEDKITQYWVMVHLICIHYVPMWPSPLTYLYQNGVMWPGPHDEDMCQFWSLYTFAFLIYYIIKWRFRGPVARQPVLPWQPFCASLVGGRPHVSPQVWTWYDHPVLLLQFLTEYVTWCCDDLWPFDLGAMSHDGTLVVNRCTKFELDKTYRSRVMTITIFHWTPA